MIERKRGRKSAAEMAVVVRPLAARPPKPPAELSEEERATWKAITATKPGDWFPPETHGPLAQYCRHMVNARRVAEMIALFMADKKPDGWIETYDRLLKMQERESRALLALARSMRLTQQSTMHPRTAGRRSGCGLQRPHEIGKRPPWESGDE